MSRNEDFSINCEVCMKIGSVGHYVNDCSIFRKEIFELCKSLKVKESGFDLLNFISNPKMNSGSEELKYAMREKIKDFLVLIHRSYNEHL